MEGYLHLGRVESVNFDLMLKNHMSLALMKLLGSMSLRMKLVSMHYVRTDIANLALVESRAMRTTENFQLMETFQLKYNFRMLYWKKFTGFEILKTRNSAMCRCYLR